MQYDTANSFSNGIALVKKGENKYLIDTTGKVVLAESDLKHLGSVGGWGSEGYLFDSYGFYKDGMFPVKKGRLNAYDFSYTSWEGYIDLSGKIVIEADWESIYGFTDGIAIVRSTSGKYGYIDQNGKVIISAKYEAVTAFSDGVAVVWEKGVWYIIDTHGNIIV